MVLRPIFAVHYLYMTSLYTFLSHHIIGPSVHITHALYLFLCRAEGKGGRGRRLLMKEQPGKAQVTASAALST